MARGIITRHSKVVVWSNCYDCDPAAPDPDCETCAGEGQVADAVSLGFLTSKLLEIASVGALTEVPEFHQDDE